VSGSAELFLGVIAASVLVMAAIQVGVFVAGLRLARRVEQMSRQLDDEIKPLIAKLTLAANEAARTASLASRQAERIDQLFGDVAGRVDETLRVAQNFIQGPARNGLAMLAGVRAAFSAMRGMRETSRRRRNMRPGVDDEESLFIG
jgi:hypothetical protein